MFPTQRCFLPENRAKPLTDEEMAERRILARQRHKEMLEKSNAETENHVQCEIVQGMSAMTVDEINSANEQQNQAENDESFIAFARVYSGTLKIGSKLYVLGPKHDPRTLK